MKRIEEITADLPKDLSFDVLKDLVNKEIWESNPINALYLAIKRLDLFDSQYYLQKNKDVLIKNYDPLFHFIKYGISEKRKYKIKKNKSNKFSIILPTYNRINKIDNTIQSILSQTYKNYELIIIDDGSTDGTMKFIKHKYIDKIINNKIRLIRYIQNKGVAHARNTGLKYAKNDWICYVDSDNYIYNNFLEVFNNNINDNYKIYYAKFNVTPENKIVGQEFDINKLIKENYIDLGVFIHHKSVFFELGGFNNKLTRLVDYELILRYTNKYNPYFIECVLIDYSNNNDKSRISKKESYHINKRYICGKYNNKPKICTIILSNNNEKYINHAIESALQQCGDFNYEIIISDNMSQDASHSYIEYYKQKYPMLILEISSDKKVKDAYNYYKCIKASDCDYLTILNGSDYWNSHTRLKTMLNYIKSNKSIYMCFNSCLIYNEDNLTIEAVEAQQSYKGNYFLCEDLLKNGNQIITLSSCFFDRKKLNDAPNYIYDNQLSEYVLAFYFENFGPIGFIKNNLTTYRTFNNIKNIENKNMKKAIQKVIRDKYKSIIQ